MSFGLTYPGYGELKHVEVEGVWQTVFCTFLVYAMLPLRSVVSDYFIRILLYAMPRMGCFGQNMQKNFFEKWYI